MKQVAQWTTWSPPVLTVLSLMTVLVLWIASVFGILWITGEV
jgi:hypothetical protein